MVQPSFHGNNQSSEAFWATIAKYECSTDPELSEEAAELGERLCPMSQDSGCCWSCCCCTCWPLLAEKMLPDGLLLVLEDLDPMAAGKEPKKHIAIIQHMMSSFIKGLWHDQSTIHFGLSRDCCHIHVHYQTRIQVLQWQSQKSNISASENEQASF